MNDTTPPIPIAEALSERELDALRKVAERGTLDSEHERQVVRLLAEFNERSTRWLAAASPKPRMLKGKKFLVVGDLHGDAEALFAIRLWRDTHAPDATLVLVGDLVDRGPFSASVASTALRWMFAPEKHRTVVVAGNHDASVAWNGVDRRFESTIEPAEFVEWLNRKSRHLAFREFGRAFVAIVARLPRWVVLPGGVLVAHSSPPHTDVWRSIHTLHELDSHPLAVEDMMWLRVAHRAPRKYPNRRSRGCQIGAEDFADGIRRWSELLTASGLTDANVQTMIRGHDHHADRVHRFRTSDGIEIITVNTMSFPIAEDKLTSPVDSVPPLPAAVFIDASEGIGRAQVLRFELPKAPR